MEVRKRERWAEHIRAEKVAEEEEEPTEGGEGSGSKTGKRAVDEPANIPLCVDLDGTLVYTDTSWESVVRLLRSRPWMAFCFPLWLIRGRARFKAEIASRVSFDPEELGYIEELLEFLREEKARGRHLILATAANEQIADSVAGHLGLFDSAFGSDDRVNLKGARKAETLVRAYGKRGFDYAGNDRADMAIWEEARTAYVVNASPRLRDRMAARGPFVGKAPMGDLTLLQLARALRIHHWSKNTLLFVPFLAAHHFADISGWIQLMVGFLAFGTCASSVYLANDLLDLESDRRHPSKRGRVITSGRLRISHGIYLALGLFVVSILLSLVLPVGFLACFLIYWLGTNLYSLILKRVYLVDVVVLAGLYILRILSGAEAVGVSVSPWLVAFSLFFFLSLALSKRYVEILGFSDSSASKISGRGYGSRDRGVVFALGVGSGIFSILVLALYMNSGHVDTLYGTAEFIWIGVVLMLFWIGRVWLRAKRGLLDDDPILFAIRDRTSYVVLALIVASVLLAGPVVG